MPLVGDSHCPVAYGSHGLVAAAYPLAVLAGVEVLRGGGNAVAMGHAHALTVRDGADGGLLAGGADPRGDGLALGY